MATKQREMPVRRFDLVVIGGSQGGLQALREILEDLPVDFPLPIAVVLHRTAQQPNLLRDVLQRWTPLSVTPVHASGLVLEPGRVYLAPPDMHLSVHADRKLELSDGRRIRGVLSSANPLFESAADVLGGRVVAVVLSGRGFDATDGVQAVRSRGGVVIAQDEATSDQFSMPRSAIASGAVDMVLPIERIGAALVELASSDASASGLASDPVRS
jgi:two-component system chemotaxis response regulator CheB